MAIVALVPTPGTTAGDQLAAVFQLPLAADVQEVCASAQRARQNAALKISPRTQNIVDFDRIIMLGIASK
jgi:hypothetical protein